MIDQELTEFLAALDKATTTLETEGIQWSRLIHATTGYAVLPFNPDDPIHRQVAGSISTAAEILVEAANSTQMVGWDVRRVNELGNALEERFSRSLNELGGTLRCRGFAQSTGYPDRRITSGDGTVAYLDLKTYDNNSETSRFRSFYHQPRQARSKITTSALHLLLAFPHGPTAGSPGRYFWKLEGFHILDLTELRVKLKGEFQASNYDLYTVLKRLKVD